MAYTKQRGLRIAFDVSGAGPVVLLQHGLLSRRATWHTNGFVAALAERFTVVAVDSLGHGESDKPADAAAYRRDARADDLAAVLDAIGAERAHLVGYSMGGWMATGFAARHPRRLLSLAIGGWDPVRGRAAPGIPFETVLAGARARAPELTAWITPEVAPAVAACWDALADVSGAEAALAACPAPVLLWSGREDACCDGMQALAARLANAAFRGVSGDHLGAMTAHADESLDAVRAILATGIGAVRAIPSEA
ncbi:MAG TPA: alpha/beta fold hydrolase [Myxococcota bacterium]|nr:alpha/beta fold hydrolase [Myxococcota bacterium]